MEDTIGAMLFSNTLMYRLSRREHVECSSSISRVAMDTKSVSSLHYHDDVCVAVHSLIQTDEIEILKCLDDILDHPVVVMDEVFAKLAIEAAPSYFPDGYTPETFLGYCAMVMGVGLHLAKNGRDPTILEFASQAVSTVLIGFMLTNEFQEEGGFDELFVTCTLFNYAFAKEKLKNLKKERNEKKKKSKQAAK